MSNINILFYVSIIGIIIGVSITVYGMLKSFKLCRKMEKDDGDKMIVQSNYSLACILAGAIFTGLSVFIIKHL